MKMLFPGFKTKAFTVSYDDGPVEDRFLTKLLKNYGIKGTFNLNSGLFSLVRDIVSGGIDVHFVRVDEPEVKELYRDFEVAMHGARHVNLTALRDGTLEAEVIGDKKKLEELTGKRVEGLAYASGHFNEATAGRLRALGVKYGRTIISTGKFDLPDDFLMWHPTCHQDNTKLSDILDRFFTEEDTAVFYLWGHSFEFQKNDRDRKEIMTGFFEKAGGRDDVWYAENIEICDYANAFRQYQETGDKGGYENPLFAEEKGRRFIV